MTTGKMLWIDPSSAATIVELAPSPSITWRSRLLSPWTMGPFSRKNGGATYPPEKRGGARACTCHPPSASRSHQPPARRLMTTDVGPVIQGPHPPA
jgi:hypothetical protein